MADQQDNLNSINILSVGLNQDSSPLSLELGEYCYALNAGFDNLSGTANQINNYPSNELCITLKYNYILIGSCKVNTGHVIFSCDVSGNSEIGLLENCTYKVLINDSCLGFRVDKQIQCTYKETFNCGRRIYWTDNNQPRRFVDIDHIPYINPTLKTVDCDALLIQPNISYPCVYYYDIQETGGLLAGMYKPYIQYADINGIGYTEWFESTGNIPIFNDPVNANFNSIQGSPVNQQTTKSILFYLSNLDTSYTHINIGILCTNAGILTAKKVATIPTTSADYLYSGLGDFIDLTLDELLIEKTIYKTAKTVTQSNGYLLWGNLSGRKDPNFQPIANNIQVTWQTYQVPAYFTAFDSKNPHTTTYKKGFMRDEVYALGIRLVYKDGSKSCVYHIPGRTLNHRANGQIINGTTDQYGNTITSGQWDTYNVAAGSVNYDNFENSTPTERYKVYNTGASYGTDPNYDSNFYGGQCYEFGEMSYWESGLLYPDTLAEDGITRLYPTGHIRHHKMPDCSIAPLITNPSGSDVLYTEPKLNYLGLNIDYVNIDYTDPDYVDVIGWELVVGDRTNNKSIIAKGLAYNTWSYTVSGNTYIIPASTFNDTTLDSCIGMGMTLGTNLFQFFSPDTTFRKVNLTISEIKNECEFYGDFIGNTVVSGLNSDRFLPVGSYYKNSNVNCTISGGSNDVRRDVKIISYITDNTINNIPDFSGILVNTYGESSVWLKTNVNSLSTGGSDSFNPPTNIDNSLTNFCGGTATGTISSYYSSLKLTQINQYGQLDNLNYLSVGMCPITETYLHCNFGGDTFLSNFTYHRTRLGLINSAIDPPSPGDTVVDGNPLEDSFNIIAINNTWIESSINTELRYEDVLPEYHVWQDPGFTDITYQQFYTAVSAFITGLTIDNYYAYNDDYSILNQGKFICSQPLDDRIDCDTNYKTRCIYTLRSQEESKQDYWLVERPNDFYDFPKKSGALWDMRELGQDKVLFRFENSIYAYPAYDTLETDANTIQLGTGGIFAQEPKELVTTDTGYGGTRNQWAFNSTEFGHFFVDDKRGNVFRLQSTIEPISNIKMYNFFSKNLTLKLLEYFPDFANFDNPSNPEGIGFTSVFDDRFKIWLLTKKDYSPVLGTNRQPLVRYTGENFVYTNPQTQRDVVVSLQDENYFCNKSFTIGFDAKTNRWVSFYSFIADSYLSDSLSFFSVKNNGVWKHHSDKYCQYYAEDFNHIIEYVVKFNGEITNKTSVQFITNTYEHFGDGSFYELQFETFKQAILYNNEACTGLLNLIVPDNNNLSTVFNLPQILSNSINVGLEKAGKCIWRNSYLWNHVANRTVNNPIFNPSCTPSIDKELNNSAINYNKSWYELARISQQWAKLRLIYPNTNYNIVTTLGVNKSIPDFM